MARTVGDVITQVREILKDPDGVRYVDASIIRFINDATLEARSIRPDLFVYSFASPLPTVSAPADPLPIPDQYFQALVYYCSGRAELRDDEFAVDGRAMTFVQALTSKLIKGA